MAKTKKALTVVGGDMLCNQKQKHVNYRDDAVWRFCEVGTIP